MRNISIPLKRKKFEHVKATAPQQIKLTDPSSCCSNRLYGSQLLSSVSALLRRRSACTQLTAKSPRKSQRLAIASCPRGGGTRRTPDHVTTSRMNQLKDEAEDLFARNCMGRLLKREKGARRRAKPLSPGQLPCSLTGIRALRNVFYIKNHFVCPPFSK